MLKGKKVVKPTVWLIFTLFLAAACILLSMFFVRKLVKARENRLLAGKGTIRQDSPISGGFTNEKGEKPTLTAEEIQEIMKNWMNRSGLIVHEPAEGQITMDEAVKAVNGWLPKMGLSEGILSGNSSVYSSLYIARRKGEKPELLSPTHSFWEVVVNGEELAGTFYVNAVTGQIFEAHVTLTSELTGVTGEQLLKSFIRLAGLKPEEQNGDAELQAIIMQGGKACILPAAQLVGQDYYVEVSDGSRMEEMVSAGTKSASDRDTGMEENWSLSANIAESNMKARVNGFYYWQYTDIGSLNSDEKKVLDKYYSTQIAAKASHMELTFSLLAEE